MNNNNTDQEIERIRAEKLKRLMNDLKKNSGDKTDKVSVSMITELSDKTFNKFISEHPLVLIDCWAPWCAPCRAVAPVVDQIAKKYSGKLSVGKLNTDDNQSTAVNMGIMGIPTLLIFKDGKLADKIVGAYPGSVIEARIKKYM